MNLLNCVQQQTHTHWQWLILDDSPDPHEFFSENRHKDPRICYMYTPNKASNGAKKNVLLAQAQGELCAHFDDDDYYAPHYLETMLKHLGNHDMVKITNWYGYSTLQKRFFYWDTENLDDMHFLVKPDGIMRGSAENITPEQMDSYKWGYGFTYMYRTQWGKSQPFEDLNFGSDYRFLSAIRQQGAQINGFPDEDGLTLHIVHTTNVSVMIPQYNLPPFLLERIFGPDIMPYCQ